MTQFAAKLMVYFRSRQKMGITTFRDAARRRLDLYLITTPFEIGNEKMLESLVRRRQDTTLRSLSVSAFFAAFVATALPHTVFAQETQPPSTVPTPTAPGDTQPPATTTPPPTTPAAATTTPATAPPSDDGPHHKRFTFGPEVGVYFPSNGKVQDAFGTAWFNFGLGIGDVQQVKNGGHLQFDFSVLAQTRGDKQIYIAPVGVSYQYGLGSKGTTGPYVGASANFVLTQLRDDDAHIVTRIRGTGGGSVFIGTSFGPRAYVQARYYGMGAIRGFNFSGFNIGTGVRF